MPLTCPGCGSRRLRFSRIRSFSERLWSWLGIRPLRCRDCRLRFIERTWRPSSMKYARCPKCWRMDLATWSEEDYFATRRQIVMLRLGAKPYRCEYCRCNFVSFRPRRERFSFRRWAKRKSPEPGPTTADR